MSYNSLEVQKSAKTPQVLGGIPTERGSKNSGVWIILLKDLGDYALYLNKSSGCFSGFEVHKIRIRKPCIIFGKEYPETRIIAGTNEFGRRAWAYPTLEIVYSEFSQFKPFDESIRNQL